MAEQEKTEATSKPATCPGCRSGGPSIGRFLVGLLVGVATTGGFVKWGWEKPAIMETPELFAASVMAATASTDLYDLSQPLDVRLRALQVVAGQRPDEIVKLDRDELGYALLDAFYRRKARANARRLRLQWTAFDVGLKQPNLRDGLERQYGVSDDLALKRAMLWRAFTEDDFLSRYVASQHGSVTPETLLPVLEEASRRPQVAAASNAVQR